MVVFGWPPPSVHRASAPIAYDLIAGPLFVIVKGGLFGTKSKLLCSRMHDYVYRVVDCVLYLDVCWYAFAGLLIQRLRGHVCRRILVAVIMRTGWFR